MLPSWWGIKKSKGYPSDGLIWAQWNFIYPFSHSHKSIHSSTSVFTLPSLHPPTVYPNPIYPPFYQTIHLPTIHYPIHPPFPIHLLHLSNLSCPYILPSTYLTLSIDTFINTSIHSLISPSIYHPMHPTSYSTIQPSNHPLVLGCLQHAYLTPASGHLPLLFQKCQKTLFAEIITYFPFPLYLGLCSNVISSKRDSKMVPIDSSCLFTPRYFS